MRVEEIAFASSVELGGIERAGKIGHEHPIARDIERDADPFHQMRDHDLGRLEALRQWRRGSPYSRAEDPHDRSSRARGFSDRARDRSARASGRRRLRCRCDLRRSRPSEFPAPHGTVGLGLHCRGPFASSRSGCARGRSWYRRTTRSGRVDPRSPRPASTSVSICDPSRFERIDSHPFAVAPIELAVIFIELDLLRREGAARRNDHLAIFSIDIGALNGTVGRSSPNASTKQKRLSHFPPSRSLGLACRAKRRRRSKPSGVFLSRR